MSVFGRSAPYHAGRSHLGRAARDAHRAAVRRPDPPASAPDIAELHRAQRGVGPPEIEAAHRPHQQPATSRARPCPTRCGEHRLTRCTPVPGLLPLRRRPTHPAGSVIAADSGSTTSRSRPRRPVHRAVRRSAGCRHPRVETRSAATRPATDGGLLLTHLGRRGGGVGRCGADTAHKQRVVATGRPAATRAPRRAALERPRPRSPRVRRSEAAIDERASRRRSRRSSGRSGSSSSEIRSSRRGDGDAPGAGDDALLLLARVGDVPSRLVPPDGGLTASAAHPATSSAASRRARSAASG